MKRMKYLVDRYRTYRLYTGRLNSLRMALWCVFIMGDMPTKHPNQR